MGRAVAQQGAGSASRGSPDRAARAASSCSRARASATRRATCCDARWS